MSYAAVPITIDGLSFPSLGRAALYLGITKQALSSRLQRATRGLLVRGRRKGTLGKCSLCGIEGHNRTTCARRP